MINRLMLGVVVTLTSAVPLFAQAPEQLPGTRWRQSALLDSPALGQPVVANTQGPAPAAAPQPPEATLPAPAAVQNPPAGPALVPAPQAQGIPLAGGPAVFGAGCGCGDGNCAPGCSQGWVTADYLFAWIQGTGLPAMVTTSPSGTPTSAAGVLGPGTTTLFGGGVVNDAVRPGVRLQAGYWLDQARTFGVEAGFMMIGSQAALYGAASDGSTILARPFTDATTGQPASALIAYPGSSAGSIGVKSFSGNFYEAHFDFADAIYYNNSFRLDGLVGYRFFRYDEGLRIDQTIDPTGASFVPGTRIASFDNFQTQNEFHGVDMGLRAQFFWDRLTVGLLAKAAFGSMRRGYATTGNTVTTVPGAAPVVSAGGLYALSSNGGQGSSHDWGVVPELGINFKWQATSYMGLQIGYSALWLDRIARAADQVDQTINPGLLPPSTAANGPQRPAVLQQRENIFLQTLNVGLVFTF